MWGDTLDDYNNKCKQHKYCAGTGQALLHWGVSGKAAWKTSKLPPNTARNSPKQDKGLQCGDEERQRGRHAWLTAGAGQSLGENKVGNEAGEIRAKARFEKICVLILPLPQNKLVTLRRSLPVPEPPFSPF